MALDSVKVSKWPAFQYALPVMIAVTLVTGIVLSILDFGAPGLMQEGYGWAGIGLSVFSASMVSVMILMRTKVREMIQESPKKLDPKVSPNVASIPLSNSIFSDKPIEASIEGSFNAIAFFGDLEGENWKKTDKIKTEFVKQTINTHGLNFVIPKFPEYNAHQRSIIIEMFELADSLDGRAQTAYDILMKLTPLNPKELDPGADIFVIWLVELVAGKRLSELKDISNFQRKDYFLRHLNLIKTELSMN